MLKRVAQSLGLVQQNINGKSRIKNQPNAATTSSDFSLQSDKIFVKIVHAGGQKELYRHAIPASKLMEKYPGTYVALPEVFKDPHRSVLWPEEYLLPGQKYIIISCEAVEKLKRNCPEESKTKESKGLAQEVLDPKITKSSSGHKVEEISNVVSPSKCKIEEKGEVEEENIVSEEILSQSLDGGRTVEESFCSAKDFYVSKDKWIRYARRKGIKRRKPFVPPLPKARSFRNLGWQPSLATVEELSP